MENEERDEMMSKFRKGEVHVVITTNLLARGVDIPEIEIVVNFDIPTVGQKPDHENYVHRIGRAGRFGVQGIALNLVDREVDEKNL